MSERKAFVIKFAQGYGYRLNGMLRYAQLHLGCGFERTASLCWRESGSAGADSVWGSEPEVPARASSAGEKSGPAGAGSLVVPPRSGKIFFSQIAKTPSLSARGRCWLAFAFSLKRVKGCDLPYFAVVATCDLEPQVEREPSMRVLVCHAFSRVLVHNGRGLLVSVCVKH